MKLRRLELVILALTLTFAVFMGGFFTGRSRSTVSITATAVQPGSGNTQISVTAESQFEAEAETQTPQYTNITEPPAANTQNQNTDSTSHGDGSPQINDGKININTATHGELTDLPGIGTALASRIIDYRTQHGNFSKIEDIRNVSGIGERRFEAIMDLIKTG